MPVSASEAFLHQLAERTFLKLWTTPNAHRAPGKELSDLVVVFGDDVVIFSDKACDFSPGPDLETGWKRWRREAIDGSIKQLAGASRRLSAGSEVFRDAKGTVPLPYALPPPERRRLHLVAIARPSLDPTGKPAGWQRLMSVHEETDRPFEVGPVKVGHHLVHVFDGETIDLLLSQLDTAPDFIAYLKGRAAALNTAHPYSFAEDDLLAASIENWSAGEGLSPHVPPLDAVTPGAWRHYRSSGRGDRSDLLNRQSRSIDRIIEHFHEAFAGGARLPGSSSGSAEHEMALRLLAAESRFARRMIVTALYDILGEEDQSVPWSITIPSPTEAGLRYLWLVYPLQTHEMLFDAHQHAFRVLGGVPRRGIYDNMKTAVDRIGTGKARQVNARFAAMASHYLFEPEFCNPASGWEKGQVEKNVQDARRRLWQRLPAFPHLDALNAWLEEQCIAEWAQIPHGNLPGTVADIWAQEVPDLMKPGRPFDGFVEHTKRVSPTCLVHFDRNRYSVPASFANRPVSLRIYPDRIVVVAEGQRVCEHARVIDRTHRSPGRTIYDWRHYLAVVQRKPGAMRNGAPFTELPDAFRQLRQQLLRRTGGDREMVDILALVLQHDEQAVLCAVELALEAGVATKTHILNILHRLVDGKTASVTPIDAPQALVLRREPQADVGRYDTLMKEVRHAS